MDQFYGIFFWWSTLPRAHQIGELRQWVSYESNYWLTLVRYISCNVLLLTKLFHEKHWMNMPILKQSFLCYMFTDLISKNIDAWISNNHGLKSEEHWYETNKLLYDDLINSCGELKSMIVYATVTFPKIRNILLHILSKVRSFAIPVSDGYHDLTKRATAFQVSSFIVYPILHETNS